MKFPNPYSMHISTHAPRTGSDIIRKSVIDSQRYFNPRSPHGERPNAPKFGKHRQLISTHAPRTGSDVGTAGRASRRFISTHAPRTGSDHTWELVLPKFRRFQPTLPARGATRPTPRRRSSPSHFNPRSPHGERLRPSPRAQWRSYFNPRSPHGERQEYRESPGLRHLFQPTLPARGATAVERFYALSPAFQPTLPARGATPTPRRLSCERGEISTHAPRTGSDDAVADATRGWQEFQPTLPARGATGNRR